MFALDTNTVIDFFRGKGRVAERLLAVRPSEIALPAISAFEVWVGVLGSRNAEQREAQYQQFLASIEVLPFARRRAKPGKSGSYYNGAAKSLGRWSP